MNIEGRKAQPMENQNTTLHILALHSSDQRANPTNRLTRACAPYCQSQAVGARIGFAMVALQDDGVLEAASEPNAQMRCSG